MVACILMHDRTTHGTLFTTSGIHDFVRSVQLVARYGSVISYRSVHLDARPNHARNIIQPLSGIHDFVQQVARYGERYSTW